MTQAPEQFRIATKPARRIALAALSIAVSAGMVAWLVWRMDARAAWELLRGAEPGGLIIAAVLVCAMPPLAALRWLGVLRAQDNMRLPFGTALRAVMLANVLNSFLPSKAGDAAKAVYLRKQAGLARGAGTVAVERLTDIFVLGLLGLAGSAIAGANWAALASAAMMAGVAVIFAVVNFAPLARLSIPAKAARILAEAREVFAHWLRRPSAMAQTFAASLAHWAAGGLVVFALVRAVGGAQSAAGYAFGVFPLATLAGLVPATVSGIGVRDAAFAALLGARLTREQATLVAFGYTIFVYWLLSLISLPAVAWQVRAYLRGRAIVDGSNPKDGPR